MLDIIALTFACTIFAYLAIGLLIAAGQFYRTRYIECLVLVIVWPSLVPVWISEWRKP